MPVWVWHAHRCADAHGWCLFGHRGFDLQLIGLPSCARRAGVLVSEIDSKFAAVEHDKIAFMPNDPLTGSALLERARKIKLFLMDIDGTLTDGGVCLISLPNNGGVAEMKGFNSQDGLGLTLAHTMGIKTGFITGRHSPAVAQRADESHVDFVYLGQADKTAAFEECMRKAQVGEDEVAYMGDDLPDLSIARRAGLAIAVANAVPELKAISHYVTRAQGGRGTAREVVEPILTAQGRWKEAIPLALA